MESHRLNSLMANLSIVLMILVPPGLPWFLLIGTYSFFCLRGIHKPPISFHVFLENLGSKMSPILAFWGIVFGYFLSDPLSSAISIFFGIFFLFFVFNLPRLLLKKDDTFERTIFSFACAIIALSGNIFMGSIMNTLENMRNEAYGYEAVSDMLWGALGALVLVLLGILAADYFCEVPLLRKRGVADYAYEKASGSLFYLSFFLGFGGNRILGPILLILSFIVVIIRQKPTRQFPTEVWQRVKTLKESFVLRFVDTSIDGRLITEAVLGSATLALLNFRFLGSVQVEPIHVVVVVLQAIPFLFFLIPRIPLFLPYIISHTGILITGIAGLMYIRSWPFCVLIEELSVRFSELLNATGRGIVVPAIFLSAALYLYLSITLDTIKGIPIDIVRRKMERAFKQNRSEGLQKLYHLSILIMGVAAVLFTLCLYPLLLEHRPIFAMLQSGEMVYYDLFWIFLIFLPLVYARKLSLSRHEIHRPIDLLKERGRCCQRYLSS